MSQHLSAAAVVIGALRVNTDLVNKNSLERNIPAGPLVEPLKPLETFNLVAIL